ncbi:MAG TPA: FHA domain-containing protein, partial [Pirellulales bacterium]|nr:FHA domain-containing protein [Pirellulales bacterium]
MAILKTADGVVHNLGEETVTVGRGASNAIPLADSACSSKHAQLVHDEGGWRIEDRGSLNGTFVNGERVPTARLGPGDRIQLGATELIFETDAVPASAAPALGAPSGGSGYA